MRERPDIAYIERLFGIVFERAELYHSHDGDASVDNISGKIKNITMKLISSHLCSVIFPILAELYECEKTFFSNHENEKDFHKHSK